MDQTLGPAPKYDPNNPGAYLTYATKAAAYYANQGLAGTDTGKYWTSESQKLPQGYQQITAGQRNVAGAGLDKAKTQQITQWKVRADYLFQQKMKELNATIQGRAKIAQMNQAAAYARTQLSQGGAMARAQMSQSSRETIAEMAAINAANGQDITHAFQTAKTQYEGQLRQWTTDQSTGAMTPAGGTPPADYGQPAPVFNFTAPTPTNNIILVPNPNGGAPIPVIQHKHQANSDKPPPHKSSATNAAPTTAAPTPAQPAAPESALGSLIHHFFGGGGGGGAAAPAGAGAGTKSTVSLKAAMALPQNRGKSAAQVQADITAHGYTVAP
jgi:hypothetical protein